MRECIVQRSRAALLPMAACLSLGLQPAVSSQAAIIAQWTFNDDTADDVSGNGHHGVPQGGFTYVDTPGDGNRGIELDGNKDAVTNNIGSGVTVPAHPDLDPTGSDEITVEVWIDVDTDDPLTGNNEWIARRSDSKYGIGFKKDGGLNRVTIHQNGGDSWESPGNMIDAPGYYHLVYSKANDGPSISLYINGVFVGFGGAGKNPWATDGPADIRFGWGGGNALKGIWDEVTIHDEKLDGFEVIERFLAGPTYPLSVDSEAVHVGGTTGIQFTSQSNTTYRLQCKTTNNWVDTGAFANGDGSDIVLFDPSGFTTTKQYRVNLALD